MEQNLLCFVVNLFSYVETLPHDLAGVLKRKKDLEYISQHRTLLQYFSELHRYKLDLRTLYNDIPNPEKYPDIKAICDKQLPTGLNIARFHYRDRPYDLWSKDFEFSQQSLHERFDMGYQDVQRAFQDPSWLELVPEGVQLHNF